MTFCKLLYHRKSKRRGVGGQKKPNLVNVVCERPLMVVDSSFLSSSLGFDLILRFSVTFVGGGGFPEEPSTGGVFCGSNPPFCTCRPNAQGTDCICKGPSC